MVQYPNGDSKKLKNWSIFSPRILDGSTINIGRRKKRSPLIKPNLQRKFRLLLQIYTGSNSNYSCKKLELEKYPLKQDNLETFMLTENEDTIFSDLILKLARQVKIVIITPIILCLFMIVMFCIFGNYIYIRF